MALDLFNNERRLIIVIRQSYKLEPNGRRLRRPDHPLVMTDLHPMQPLWLLHQWEQWLFGRLMSMHVSTISIFPDRYWSSSRFSWRSDSYDPCNRNAGHKVESLSLSLRPY